MQAPVLWQNTYLVQGASIALTVEPAHSGTRRLENNSKLAQDPRVWLGIWEAPNFFQLRPLAAAQQPQVLLSRKPHAFLWTSTSKCPMHTNVCQNHWETKRARFDRVIDFDGGVPSHEEGLGHTFTTSGHVKHCRRNLVLAFAFDRGYCKRNLVHEPF